MCSIRLWVEVKHYDNDSKAGAHEVPYLDLQESID